MPVLTPHPTAANGAPAGEIIPTGVPIGARIQLQEG